METLRSKEDQKSIDTEAFDNSRMVLFQNSSDMEILEHLRMALLDELDNHKVKFKAIQFIFEALAGCSEGIPPDYDVLYGISKIIRECWDKASKDIENEINAWLRLFNRLPQVRENKHEKKETLCASG